MSKLKKFLLYTLAGAFLGWLVSLLVVPGLLGWWNTPGNQVAAMCACQEVTKATVSQFIRAQLVCMGIGIGLSLVLAVFFKRKPIAGTVPSKTHTKT